MYVHMLSIFHSIATVRVPDHLVFTRVRFVSMKELIKGGTWPPSRGSFNWRLAFTIVLADSELGIASLTIDVVFCYN